MNLPRRQFLRLALGASALQFLSRIASALDYPVRPVRIIVGFPPGSGADVIARLMAQRLSERLGQPFFVENRLGAAGNLAAEAVVRASADGHTLLFVTPSNGFNATLYNNLSFNFIRDITPVASLTRGALVMVVNPAFPAWTVPELIAYARANPAKINMASTGNGTASHIAGELFKEMAGVNMLHVPYRGDAPALTDLIGGQVQVMFDTIGSCIEYVRSGKLRALAVTTATRSEALPDIPVLGDFVPGYEASGWQGLGVPRSTPAEIVDRLNQEINAGLADPGLKARLADLGYTAFAGSPSDFGTLIAEETAKWGKVIRAANIRPE